MPAQITLYDLERSRSQRIGWLLEELKVDYNVETFKRNERQRADPALFKIHPLGKAPVISVDGKIIAESAVIIDYLIKNFGQGSELEAKNEEEAFDINYYLHHSEATLQPCLLLLFVTDVTNKQAPYLLKSVAKKVTEAQDDGYALPELKLNLKYLDDKLKTNGTGFFVGDHLSGADIIYSFPLLDAKHRKFATAEDYPHIFKWIDLITARPAYKAALEKTGKPAKI
ncbi:bifunctional glutathione transferase/peroxidase [Sugiyamaella lignohabitans]|uniref:Bifunctional glutathione transferase/peroxidase n=1 Tax=Sugiyamaella lignohabitans TaxID=796027 RepID=A0A167D9J3_9ASCO|nr:bifunctional glutathione transferase/peroxidase [Sugiyamaella lignohabitans]ANB12646.1 bifunctional glutathione transferase/peroxidase [Sugiyamaella lignohabitans]